jgi:hypothetical protein
MIHDAGGVVLSCSQFSSSTLNAGPNGRRHIQRHELYYYYLTFSVQCFV